MGKWVDEARYRFAIADEQAAATLRRQPVQEAVGDNCDFQVPFEKPSFEDISPTT